MDVQQINVRIDRALKDNRRAEVLVMTMASGIFVAGMAMLFLAYWAKNPYIVSGSVISNGFLYWPIRAILKVRKDNLVLQTLPVLIADLPPAEVTKEVKKLAEYLRGKA